MVESTNTEDLSENKGHPKGLLWCLLRPEGLIIRGDFVFPKLGWWSLLTQSPPAYTESIGKEGVRSWKRGFVALQENPLLSNLISLLPIYLRGILHTDGGTCETEKPKMNVSHEGKNDPKCSFYLVLLASLVNVSITLCDIKSDSWILPTGFI